MKRTLTLLCALLFSFSMALAAQSSSGQSDNDTAKQNKKVAKAEKKEAKAAEKGKDMRLTGWVKEEAGKTVFVNDKDKQSWDISNPDAVKGHEGHHVKVKAKLNESDHSLNVEKLTMLRKGKQTGEEQKAEEKK